MISAFILTLFLCSFGFPWLFVSQRPLKHIFASERARGLRSGILVAMFLCSPAFAQVPPPPPPPVLPPIINNVTPNSGPTAGGTTVTINGTFISGVANVSFGGVSATSFQVLSTTQISAVTPPNVAGPSVVSVGNPNVLVSFLLSGFTYLAPVVAPPEASINVSPATVSEDGPTNLVFTVSLSRAVTSATTVFLSRSGTATSGDYGVYSDPGVTAVTIPAGGLTATIIADPTPDALQEPDETVIYTIGPSVGDGRGAPYIVGSPSSATGTILNVPFIPPFANITVAPAAVLEDGARNLVFTVSLSRAVSTETYVSLEYSGTAGSFDARGLSVPGVRILANTLSTSFMVEPNADPFGEPDETVEYTIVSSNAANGVYAVGANATATGIILNDDGPVISPPSASISVSPAAVTEDGGVGMVYTVILSSPSPNGDTVSLDTSGTADRFDYTDGLSFSNISIPRGGTTASFTVRPIIDSTGEPDETVIYTMRPSAADPPTYTISAQSSATGTILNDDGPVVPFVLPTVSISVSPAAVTEDGAANLIFTVSLSRTMPMPTMVDLSYSGAANIADYSNYGSRFVVVPANTLSMTFVVDPTSDIIPEADETVTFEVIADGRPDPAYLPGPQRSATGTILNDDGPYVPFVPPVASISVAPASVLEDGPNNLAFTVSLSRQMPTPTTIFLFTGGTANSSDYSGFRGNQITVPANTLSATFEIDPNSDALAEADETVILNLSPSFNISPSVDTVPTYTLGANATASGVIINDDGPFVPVLRTTASISVAPASVTEDGPTNLVFTITMSEASSTPTTILIGQSGTAYGGIDYSGGIFSSIIMPANTLSVSAVVYPIADADFEPDETLTYSINVGFGPFAPDGSLTVIVSPGSQPTATGTILNDDPVVIPAATITLLNTPASVSENLGNLRYRVDLSQAIPTPTTVNLTYSGTAASGVDYRATPTSLVVPASTRSVEFTIDTFNNQVIELDKTLRVSIVAGGGYTLGTANTADATILNDDVPAAVISVSPPSLLEDSGQDFVFTVRLLQPSPLGPTRVRLTALSGGFYANSGADYSGFVNEVVFPTNTTVQTFNVRPVADTVKEGDELVGIVVQAEPAGVRPTYSVLPSAPTQAIIWNDDYLAPTIVNVAPLTGSAGINSPTPAIVIQGTEFDAPNKAVRFGAVSAAAFAVTSPTTIQATPRPLAFADLNQFGLASRTVTVQTSAGSGTSTQEITFDGGGPTPLFYPSDINVMTDPGRATAAVSYFTPLWVDFNPDTVAALRQLIADGTLPPELSNDPLARELTPLFAAFLQGNDSALVTLSNGTALPNRPASANFVRDLGAIFSDYLDTPITSISGPASGSSLPVGTHLVTFSARDTYNNPSTRVLKIIVSDGEKPVIVSTPTNIVVNAAKGLPSAVVTWVTPTVIDNIAGATITQTTGPASGTAFPLGITTVTYAAKDTAGNQAISSFTVTVLDAEAPSLTGLPTVLRVNTDATLSTAIVTFAEPIATDNSGVVTLTQTQGPPSGSAFPIGMTKVTYSVTDGAGNVTTASIDVIVTDAERPVIVALPVNRIVNTDAGLPTAVVTWNLPTVSDNVPGVSIMQTAGPVRGSAFPIGLTNITYLARDVAGNQTQSSFTISVVDPEVPTLSGVPVDVNANTELGRSTAIVAYSEPTASDNSGVVTLTRTQGPASGSPFPIGATIVTFTATDGSGNQTTKSFTVIVADKEAPVISSLSANILVDAPSDQARVIVNWSVPTATDNVSGVRLSQTAGPASGTAFPIGVTTITYRAVDVAGNATLASFTVTVRDVTPPVFVTFPANLIASTDAGRPTATIAWVEPTATDNSGTVTLERTTGLASGSAFPVGTTIVTFTATDGSGNQTVKAFTVTVADREAPVIFGIPSNIVANNDAGLPTAVVTWVQPTATDNLPGVALRQTEGPASGTAFPIGITRVTYVATDAAGNTASASFSVTIIDSEPPSVVGLSANLAFDIDYPSTTRIVTWVQPSVRDNVAGATIAQTAGPVSGSAFPIGVTTVTYEAKDVGGNVTKAGFTVTVRAIAPGSVSFIFETQDAGGFAIASPESALNRSIQAISGRNTISGVLIRPGTYPIAFSVPQGVGVSEANCSAGGSVLNASSKTGQIVLVTGQAVTCTIKTLASQRVATETIGSLFTARQALIMSNQASTDRRINRLLGRGSQGGSVNLGGLQFATNSPLNLAIGRDGRATFNYSSLRSSQLIDAGTNLGATNGEASDRLPGQRRVGLDFWAEGTLAQFNAGGGDGSFAIVHMGADYLATKNLLVGAAAQIDWIDFNASATSSAKGRGYMIGPYATVRITDALFFDARLTAGKASNDVSPYGTYVDEVESTRSLASAALIGSFQSGTITIRPEARLNWFVEESDSYKDALGVVIPSVRSAIGTLDVGPEFRWGLPARNLGDFEFSLGFAGVWAFDQRLESNAGITLDKVLLPEFRGRAKSGALLTLENGVVFNVDVFVDGIGGDSYRSWGGSIGIRLGF